jgi:hypothetical protein
MNSTCVDLSQESVQLQFDYTFLDPGIRQQVQQHTAEIKGLMRRAAQDIILIGQKLIVVKEQLPYGQFGSWLRAEFEWSDQTALNFMNVARRFSQIPNGLEFAPKALYALASTATPESARQEALERADAGEYISPSFTSEADLLFYYIPGDELVYVLRFDQLRKELPRWIHRYPARSIQNQGYSRDPGATP